MDCLVLSLKRPNEAPIDYLSHFLDNKDAALGKLRSLPKL